MAQYIQPFIDNHIHRKLIRKLPLARMAVPI